MEQTLYWLVGVLGVPLVNWLKQRWGLYGRAALWLTTAVAAVLGLLASLLSQRIGTGSLEPQELLAAFGQVLAAATLAYKLLSDE
ncbi:MAG: hypothetical protein KIS88_05920 [Anaerolineales bacterium]|nr:hypothetical protein [Anaerolineales bacterium]